MSEMIADPYATRRENLRYIFRLLPCVLLGHAPALQRWPHCIDCRRCGRSLAYGPEITDDWPEAMKAAWRGGKREMEAYAEENQRRSAASADTHPKDGDAFAAPLVSGAVPKADAHGESA